MALQFVYRHHHRLHVRLSPLAFQPLTIEELRSGPLGRDLRRMALFARGEVPVPKEEILAAIEAVLVLLFWPAVSDDYRVPQGFWDTELGRMLALAKFRAFRPEELVPIGTAADQLGVTRTTIYDWLDSRILDYVRDHATGRTFVVKCDVDYLRKRATRLAATEARRSKALEGQRPVQARHGTKEEG